MPAQAPLALFCYLEAKFVGVGLVQHASWPHRSGGAQLTGVPHEPRPCSGPGTAGVACDSGHPCPPAPRSSNASSFKVSRRTERAEPVSVGGHHLTVDDNHVLAIDVAHLGARAGHAPLLAVYRDGAGAVAAPGADRVARTGIAGLALGAGANGEEGGAEGQGVNQLPPGELLAEPGLCGRSEPGVAVGLDALRETQLPTRSRASVQARPGGSGQNPARNALAWVQPG